MLMVVNAHVAPNSLFGMLVYTQELSPLHQEEEGSEP